LSQDRVELVQIELAGESRLFNKALKSIDMPTNALVAAIVRDGVLEVPGGDDVFQKGDRVYLIGSPDGVLSAERLFSRTREARRVCIVGGGVVGKSLARELKRSGAKVMLIEKDRETAEAISVELDGIDVVHGDGTHQGLLEEEEVDTYDLFCAVTAMDEVNLMASLLAKRIGCHRTAVTVQRADYVPIYKQLGIDIVLSPRKAPSRATTSSACHAAGCCTA
ncbi:MAG: FAD-dependent oxidoreductase, partial [Myxococcales bacterium]|nr:FAD-dependent oxidoreductase [Myxococcales bacterium]